MDGKRSTNALSAIKFDISTLFLADGKAVLAPMCFHKGMMQKLLGGSAV